MIFLKSKENECLGSQLVILDNISAFIDVEMVWNKCWFRSPRTLQGRWRILFQRMRLTEGALVDSSGKISDVNKEYADNYSGALKTASEAMTSLKRKIDTDDKFIWWSFIFFVAVCVFIILKRLMILSLSAWVLAMISKPIMFGYREVVEPVYRALVGDTEVIPGVEEL